MSTLGERLRKARERKGLSQIEVARRTNINNKTLSRYEKNGTEPDSDTLKMLAELYDVTADFLLGIENNAEEDDPIPQSVQYFLRTDTSGLSKKDQELLREDLVEYFEFRKNRLLKDKDKD